MCEFSLNFSNILYEGLCYFAETGRTTMYPNEFYNKFTIEERLDFFYTLKEYVSKENKNKYLMVNNQLFNGLTNVTISYFNEMQTILFIASYNSNIMIVNLNIPYLTQEFSNFFKKLPESMFVYSTEETIELIEDIIVKLEANKNLDIN